MFSVHSVQAAVVKKKNLVCSVIPVVSTLCPRPSIFHLVDQQPLVLSCGLWINYSSDVTQQKPLFIICVTRQFLNQNPGSQPHMKGTAITAGGGRGVKTSHQYPPPPPHPPRHIWPSHRQVSLLLTQWERLGRRRRKVHDLKGTSDSRKMCFSCLLYFLLAPFSV